MNSSFLKCVKSSISYLIISETHPPVRSPFRQGANLLYDVGMPTSITPPPADDEVECARCGAYFYYELTRCPNCGVNVYEPDPEDDEYWDPEDDED
jgi:hypothetical protein